MSGPSELEAAALASREARARLLGTAHELQTRLEPRRLIDEATTNLTTRASGLVEKAETTARRQPFAVIGIGAAAALFLLRRPIARGARQVFRRKPRRKD